MSRARSAISAVNIKAFTILNTAFGSSRKSCAQKWAKSRPFMVCACAAMEGNISPKRVRRSPVAKLCIYAQSSTAYGVRTFPSSMRRKNSEEQRSTLPERIAGMVSASLHEILCLYYTQAENEVKLRLDF